MKLFNKRGQVDDLFDLLFTVVISFFLLFFVLRVFSVVEFLAYLAVHFVIVNLIQSLKRFVILHFSSPTALSRNSISSA